MIYRSQTPAEGKTQVYVIDYLPYRMFELLYDYAMINYKGDKGKGAQEIIISFLKFQSSFHHSIGLLISSCNSCFCVFSMLFF